MNIDTLKEGKQLLETYIQLKNDIEVLDLAQNNKPQHIKIEIYVESCHKDTLIKLSNDSLKESILNMVSKEQIKNINKITKKIKELS